MKWQGENKRALTVNATSECWGLLLEGGADGGDVDGDIIEMAPPAQIEAPQTPALQGPPLPTDAQIEPAESAAVAVPEPAPAFDFSPGVIPNHLTALNKYAKAGAADPMLPQQSLPQDPEHAKVLSKANSKSKKVSKKRKSLGDDSGQPTRTVPSVLAHVLTRFVSQCPHPKPKSQGQARIIPRRVPPPSTRRHCERFALAPRIPQTRMHPSRR